MQRMAMYLMISLLAISSFAYGEVKDQWWKDSKDLKVKGYKHLVVGKAVIEGENIIRARRKARLDGRMKIATSLGKTKGQNIRGVTPLRYHREGKVMYCLMGIDTFQGKKEDSGKSETSKKEKDLPPLPPQKRPVVVVKPVKMRLSLPQGSKKDKKILLHRLRKYFQLKLIQTGRFRVIDRSEGSQNSMEEQDFGEKGPVKKGKKAKMGTIKAAEYYIVPSLLELRVKKRHGVKRIQLKMSVKVIHIQKSSIFYVRQLMVSKAVAMKKKSSSDNFFLSPFGKALLQGCQWAIKKHVKHLSKSAGRAIKGGGK